MLEQSARLQAVKCSPADGNRSTPTPAMVANCPHLLLSEEIKVLSPGAIVGFGLPVYEAFKGLGPPAIQDGDDYLAWGEIATERRRTKVFWLYHPAGPYWARSHSALLDHLEARDEASPPV